MMRRASYPWFLDSMSVPGVPTMASLMLVMGVFSMTSRPMTVTAAGTSSIGRAVRVAVTVIDSLNSAESAMSCLISPPSETSIVAE